MFAADPDVVDIVFVVVLEWTKNMCKIFTV